MVSTSCRVVFITLSVISNLKKTLVVVCNNLKKFKRVVIAHVDNSIAVERQKSTGNKLIAQSNSFCEYATLFK